MNTLKYFFAILYLMNSSQTRTVRLARIALILSIILVPILLLFGIMAALSGLDGINPENQGKVVVYPIPENTVVVVQALSLILAPISVGAVVVSILNLKFKKSTVSWSIICFFIFSLGWCAFVSWALSHEYVSETQTNSSKYNTNDPQNNSDGSLKIYDYDIN